MPYDAQGRWIEENEWEQMMREQAAQRVQAFSQYNDVPTSFYPNQAAPYGSFPYADPTPAIWDSSPERLRQDVPADPKYQGWDFNQEPIADTSAISNVPQMAFGAFGAKHVLPVTPPGTMNFQDFLDKVGPVQSGTRDAYYMPDGTVRNAAGDLVSTDTTFDPTAGLAATDPNLQGVTPTSTAMVGTNAFGIPDRTYGPTTETVPVTDPNSYPSMDVPYGYVTDPSTILDIAQSVPDPVFLPPVTDFIAEVPSSDTTTDVAPSMSGVDYSAALSAVSTVPQMADTSSSLGRVAQDALSRIGITDSPYQDAIDETGNPVIQDLLSHFDLSNVPGGRTANTVREVLEDKDESLADYIRDVQIDKYKQDNPNATIDDVVAVITSGNKNKTFMMESDTDFAEKIAKAKKSDEIMIAKARQQKAAAAQRKADLARQKAAAKAKRDLDKLKAKQTAADKNRIAAAAQEATRRSLEKQMQGWLGRDERDESAMAQIQAALDHIADLQGTGVTSGSTGDRSGEVRDAMRSVGYGGPEWT